MIRFLYDCLFKNKFIKSWKQYEVSIRDEYTQKQKSLVQDMDNRYSILKVRLEDGHKDIVSKVDVMEREKRDLEDLEKRVFDRKSELGRVQEELKIQIRLLEAKASPDNIWTTAFSQGFSKAWDVMIPHMTEGLDRVKDQIRTQEIDASLPRVEIMIRDRLNSLRDRKLVETHDLESKRLECEHKFRQSHNDSERSKLTHYMQIIDWILGNRNGN